jgi:hypothetical protein
LASLGLKLANIRIDVGSDPSAVAGAVKWPAVTITRSRIKVPLTNARSSTGCPAASTLQTMTAPTFGYLLSTSTTACAKVVIDPEASASTPARALAIDVLREVRDRLPTLIT